ncbi:MAG: CPBP family intramembrane metalloprotease [Gammaproteobacteria bacterium]|nr:CPBP family intramembrane metalloprotease [Gammaproteobacteria bacterium]
MRAFAIFIALMAVAVIGGALLAYPAYTLAHDLGADWPFHRVANRLAMLVLLIGLLWLLRRMHLNHKAALGYGLERSRFIRTGLLALALGMASMLPIIGLLVLLGIREPDAALSLAGASGLALQGLIAGLAVAFIEETFLRGAMHTAIERESGPRAAVLLTAAVYASLHFLNRVRIPHDSVDWTSGWTLIGRTFNAFADPARIFDSFLALFAVGVLLGMVRVRFGNIAACIGLHAGWVWVITISRELTTRNAHSPFGALVGSYDGVVGYLVLGWTVLLIAVFWLWWGRKRGAVRSTAA